MVFSRAVTAIAEFPNRAWLSRLPRLALALAVVWAVGTCDLLLTHAHAQQNSFYELNPVAQAFVRQPLYVLATYKYGLLGVASVIFMLLRSHRCSEWGAWFLAGSHAVLIGYWCVYLASLG